jgi:methylenetetrahydrofolate--tRNA-(uracil-5-)-methyltransferase
MKPVGLEDPRTGELPCAVVQLRPENVQGSMYGMVGFQTRLRYGEQERIFRKIPGLENARFVRFGSIHRNTYICGPSALAPSLQHRTLGRVLLAGQVTGSEGYMAAVATGLIAGINAGRLARGDCAIVPPEETLIGGLTRYVSRSSPIDFRPTNVNFGLRRGLGGRERDRRRRNLLLSERSVLALGAWMRHNGLEAGLESKVEQGGSVS